MNWLPLKLPRFAGKVALFRSAGNEPFTAQSLELRKAKPVNMQYLLMVRRKIAPE
jgi:hypothetical protein